MRHGADDKAANLKADIAARATALGFDVCRVTSADAIPLAGERLAQFLKDGHHATMAWMEETAERRSDPRALWAETRSVIMLGMNYGPDSDPLAHLAYPEQAGISVYARNRDYHDIIKGKLKTLAGQIVARAYGKGAGGDDQAPVDVKVFVDTAPVMEKPLAEAAGLGWQGKHTNLVSRELGSWLFLGAIFTTLDLPSDDPEVDHCGSCRACLDACPTDAFPAPYRLDARRCISYLTIEHKGPIPHEFRAAMGNRIYGCDDCLAACPWNKFAVDAHEAKLIARDDLKTPALADFLTYDDAAFRKFFVGSPVKRIGRDRFLRNVLIAAGNSGLSSMVAPVEALLEDPAAEVRGAAIWALSRLMDTDKFSRLSKKRSQDESDSGVLAEWELVRQSGSP